MHLDRQRNNKLPLTTAIESIKPNVY